ncbi:MAG: phosphatase PAP2 family protein [Solobacterium sp.]|nr:phosphatase PAP2 family protein [Solobacterium sp.]
MDIDLRYLLFLQQIRQSLGGSFDEFFNSLSKFAVDLLPYLPYIIYWSYDRKLGYRFLSVFRISVFLNGLIKLTACVYRPWIRSDQIVPAGDSKTAATGYSFPSGHTTEATALYGTAAVSEYKRRRWLSVLCIFLIVLTGFSRNYLGVHTPQDVLVAITFSSLVIFAVITAEKKIGDNAKIYDYLTFAGIPIVILSIAYILLKPYPMDYVDGKLLVDPVVMRKDTFAGIGAFAGFLLASYLERHYWHNEIPVGSKTLPLMAGLGVILLFGWKKLFGPAIILPMFGTNPGTFIVRFTMSLFGVLLYPMIIRKFCTEEVKAKKEESK